MFKQIIAGLFGQKETTPTQPVAPVAVEPEPAQPPINIDQAIDQLRSLIHHPEEDRISSLRLCITFCESVVDVQLITKRINWPANRWSDEMQTIYGTALDEMCVKEFDAHFDSNDKNRIGHLFWIARQTASAWKQLQTRVCAELLREIRSSKTTQAACDLLSACRSLEDKYGLDATYQNIALFHARAILRQEIATATTVDEALSLRKSSFWLNYDHDLATKRVAQLCGTIEEVNQTSRIMTGVHYSFLAMRASELCSTLDEAYTLWSERKIPDIQTQIVEKWDTLATTAVAGASSAEQLESLFLRCREGSPPALQAIEKMALIPR